MRAATEQAVWNAATLLADRVLRRQDPFDEEWVAHGSGDDPDYDVRVRVTYKKRKDKW